MEKVIIKYKMEEKDNKIEYKTIGNIEIYSDYYLLSFVEPDTKINAKYQIYNNYLSLERKGNIYMKASFVKNKNTDCLVITDFNYEMNMKVYTFLYNIEKENDYNMVIKLKYNLDIDQDNFHSLTLEIKNKNISIAKK